jgi:CRISP-associated protein Cas1
VVTFGRTGLSPALMSFCAEEGVTITYLSENGRFLARVEGPISGNVLLRRAQVYLHHDVCAFLACVGTLGGHIERVEVP